MASGLVNVMKQAERDERAARAAATAGSEADSPSASLAAPEYRAICSSAVSSLALGVLSVLALLSWWMLAMPVAAILLGAFALRQIRSRGDELTGAPLARIGLALAVLFGATGAARLSYIYATEVPEGYTRIDYAPLQPESADAVGVPASATALEGEKVFIKGFIQQGKQLEGIRTFLLVRDQGDCCFGGNPKVTERIQVTLADPAGTSYSTGLTKVAGVFHVRPMPEAVDGPGGVIYHLDEAMLR